MVKHNKGCQRSKLIVQARPMSSFSYRREISLRDARPSVLEAADQTAEETSNSKSLKPACLSVSTPRRVLARFQDSDEQDEGNLAFLASGEVIDTQLPALTFPNTQNQTLQDHNEDSAFFTKSRVQFEDMRNEVAEYSPSSQGTPHRALSNWQSMPFMTGNYNCGPEMLERPHLSPEDVPDDEQPVSRCTSNLALRAGTFNELVSCEKTSPLGRAQSGLSAQGSLSSRLSIRTSGWSPTKVVGDAQLSRRATNMEDRAGTFEELVTAPNDLSQTCHPTAQPNPNKYFSGPIPTEIELHECAPAGKPSIPSYWTGGGTLARTTSTRQDPEAEISGTISRRYTNMSGAAGAFEELVDEDGDILSSTESEGLETENPGAEGVGRSTVSLTGIVQDTTEADHSPNCENAAKVCNILPYMTWPRVHQQPLHRLLPTNRPDAQNWIDVGGMLPSDFIHDVSEKSHKNPDYEDPCTSKKQELQTAFSETHGEVLPSHPTWSMYSLRLAEANSSAAPSRGDSLAWGSTCNMEMSQEMPPSLGVDTGTLSGTLNSTLSIRTPRAVIQKFHSTTAEPSAAVVSTAEASKKLKSHNTGLLDSESGKPSKNATPCKLQLLIPEEDLAGKDLAVLTPQEWLNNVGVRGVDNKMQLKLSGLADAAPAQTKELRLANDAIDLVPFSTDSCVGVPKHLFGIRTGDQRL